MHAVDTKTSDGRRILISCSATSVTVHVEDYEGSLETIATLDQTAAWSLYEIGYLMVMRPPILMPNLNRTDTP